MSPRSYSMDIGAPYMGQFYIWPASGPYNTCNPCKACLIAFGLCLAWIQDLRVLCQKKSRLGPHLGPCTNLCTQSCLSLVRDDDRHIVMLLFLFNATVIIITGITELAVKSGVDKLKYCRSTRNYSSSWGHFRLSPKTVS